MKVDYLVAWIGIDRKTDGTRTESTIDCDERSTGNRPAGQCLSTLPTKDLHVTSSISYFPSNTGQLAPTNPFERKSNINAIDRD